MTDLSDLVEELLKISSSGVAQVVPFTAMHHLRKILNVCFDYYFCNYYC